MFQLLRMTLVCVFGSLLFAKIADAAEVTCINYLEIRKQCSAALLSGEIVKGDYEKVAAIYAQNHPYLGSFSLLSNGGDVEEATKIGRLFRRYLILAEAPFGHGASAVFVSASALIEICRGASCVCASSCALIWFGATTRWGTVGLHRPRFAGTRFAELSASNAEKVYRPVIENLTHYLEEMEAPKTAIEAMMATSSSEVEWVDSGKLDRPPSFAEWIEAACGHLPKATSEELDSAINLKVRELNSKQNVKLKLSKTEEMLLHLLEQKINARNQCEGSLISKNREKLPPPDILSTANDPPKSTARLTPSAKAESNAPVHKDQNSKRRGYTVRELRELEESFQEKE